MTKHETEDVSAESNDHTAGTNDDAAATHAARPLAGRTVMITRAQAQAAELSNELERYGARVVLCPTIEIVEPDSYEPLDEAISNLYGYDWLVFTSVNGVDSFMRRFEVSGHDVSEIDELRVCAVGAPTADRLRDVSVHVDVVPEQFKAEGVFAALESYLGGRAEMANQNFLIPRAAAARDYLPAALAEAGARVDVIPAYRTIPPRRTDRARIEALLVGGGIDCITFASSSAVANFARLFDASDLGHILDGVKVACIGDITARTAADFGLITNIRPGEHTIPALARAVASHFKE